MHEATITVEYVNQPDKNPDFGSVKCGSIYYGVPKNMLSQFEKGKSYTIGYTTTEARNGKTFYNLKELRSSAAPAPQTNGSAAVTQSNGNRDPDYDLKVGAQAKFNVLAAVAAARWEGAIDRNFIADLFCECLVGHQIGWRKYQQMLAAARQAQQRVAAPFDDRIDDFPGDRS